MPGPKATNRKHRESAKNSPNEKTRKRLEKRISMFTERNSQNGQTMHKPGSQNRKK